MIQALQLGRVDLYGDSYGSFFAQVFASRFPHLIRSVTLDSTYETIGLDPWYRSSVAVDEGRLRRGLQPLAGMCRAPRPDPPGPGSACSRRAFANTPSPGPCPGPTGAMQSVSMDVVGLVDLLNDAAGDPMIYRGLDAAGRALLQDSDPAAAPAPVRRAPGRR